MSRLRASTPSPVTSASPAITPSAAVEGKFVIILNVDHVLSLDEMSSLAGIGAGTEITK